MQSDNLLRNVKTQPETGPATDRVGILVETLKNVWKRVSGDASAGVANREIDGARVGLHHRRFHRYRSFGLGELNSVVDQVDENFESTLRIRIDPVSYTHLDVYKRQLCD